jgi:mercuric ion transport protein
MEEVQSRTIERKSSWGLIGAVVSAFVASLCCIGPLFLLAVGISGAWISNLTALTPYRPIFMIVTLGFLGVAFYTVYRKPKTGSCTVGPCGTFGSRRTYKIILWVVTILVVGLLAFPYLVPYVFAGDETTGKILTEQVVLEVKNMDCISCTVTVKKSLTRLKGVKEVKVTLDPPEALIVFDPSRVKMEELIKATSNAGYPSSVKKK